jgi:hypothetical protein
MIIQLNPTIPVFAKQHGEGEAIMIIDYGINVNTVWVVRFSGGAVKHFYSDDILVYGNPMDGNGWDIDIPDNWKKDTIKKLPKTAKRNTSFLKEKKYNYVHS